MQDYFENKKKAFIQQREAEKKLSCRAFRKRETTNYIKHSKEVESKAAKFKNQLEVINAKTNSMIKIQHNPLQRNKDDYLWFLYNNKLLEEKLIQDGGYEAMFLTTTMPTEFHKFSTTTNQFNPLYDWKTTINEGYKIQNQAFREIYKNFRINRKHEKIFFCKAFEPHKNMSPHMHCILYVKKEHYDKLKTHVDRVVAKYRIGISETQRIKNITRSISYVLKYINKTNNPDNEESFHFFNGWKKKNRIRVYTHSNMELERYIFKKVNSVLRLSEGLENQSPIAEVLKHCDISINTNCFIKQEFKNNSKKHSITQPEGKEIKKSYKNSDARYEVIINRTRTKFTREESYNIIKAMSYFEAKGLKLKPHEKQVKGLAIYAPVPCTIVQNVYNYKIDSFTIRDTQTDEILYSKEDFMLLDDFKEEMYLEDGDFILE